jgi:hypothetical protein
MGGVGYLTEISIVAGLSRAAPAPEFRGRHDIVGRQC